MLQNFLDAKPLFYDVIDYDRMPRVYERVKHHFTLPKIVHIVGTNGKGTTGRFLATALHRLGYNTGHYTSPHILNFNERVWYNGSDVSMELLEESHQMLLNILEPDEADALSYFEYTTLLAMLFFSEKTDFIILEAGLGGEHDATASFESDLTLITPIAKDHEAFLGSTIESIATTKINAVKRAALIAAQPDKKVYAIAKRVLNEKNLPLIEYRELLEAKDLRNIEAVAEKEAMAPYLQKNLQHAVSALKYFQLEYRQEDISHARLFGRLTYLSKNIILDVGHNLLAAEAIANALKEKQYILVYNSYKDKEYEKILKTLQGIIKHVEVIEVDNIRIEERLLLQKSLEKLDIEYREFHSVDPEESYLVFGSFSVVEAFLKVYNG